MTFGSLFQKKADKLDMSPQELSVWGVQGGADYKCEMQKKETSNETDFFTCKIEQTSEAKFQKLKVIPHCIPLSKDCGSTYIINSNKIINNNNNNKSAVFFPSL